MSLPVKPTNVRDPDYFHKVVDCQWACPAHTNVPEYIRLIAQGRYADAYMLNRESNVFPGILGRTCDRPCEPACRRGRVEEKPVAICRLKRVAADLRGDVSDRLPTRARRRRTASASPASARAPPRWRSPTICCRSATRSPCSRSSPGPRGPDALEHPGLPPARRRSSTEEIDMILRMGSRRPLQHAHHEHEGAAAPGLRRHLRRQRRAARQEPRHPRPLRRSGARPHRHRLARAPSPSSTSTHIGERVLIIGVGNTAMDCCRTSRRLGGKDDQGHGAQAARLLQGVALGARGRRRGARRDRHQPRAQALRDRDTAGSKGMEFQRYESTRGRRASSCRRPSTRSFFPADDVILAIGQEAAFPWIERDIGIEFDKWDVPVVDKVTFQCSLPRRLLRRRRRVGPAQHHLGGRARAPGGHLASTTTARASPLTERPPPMA